MTAKAISQNHISAYSAIMEFDVETNTMSNLPSEYKFKASEFKQFCNQLCREQREICAKAVNYREIEFANGSMPVIDRETIINAPMPEL